MPRFAPGCGVWLFPRRIPLAAVPREDADVRDAGPDEIMDLDEEDPSEAWVAQSLTGSLHTPNGPLGSDRPPRVPGAEASPTTAAPPPAPAPAAATAPHATTGTKTVGIEMPKSKKKTRDPVGSPLTSSVQENFRGFTYHGGESVVPDGAGVLKAQVGEEEEEAVQDEEFYREEDDDEAPVGRYAHRRRNGDLEDGFDDDMHF